MLDVYPEYSALKLHFMIYGYRYLKVRYGSTRARSRGARNAVTLDRNLEQTDIVIRAGGIMIPINELKQGVPTA
ncbi:hypothetical protein Moror_14615, partial [Moniliophthora roreri MCA 2997]